MAQPRPNPPTMLAVWRIDRYSALVPMELAMAGRVTA